MKVFLKQNCAESCGFLAALMKLFLDSEGLVIADQSEVDPVEL